MDEVKDKFKGFMKKVSSSSSSSSGRFQGQGRVLGSSSSSSSSSSNPIPYRQANPPPPPPSSDSPTAKPKPLARNDPPRPGSTDNRNPDPKPPNGFDPFGPLITSSKTSQNGWSLGTLECPVCQLAFASEQQVSEHVESCLTLSKSGNAKNDDEGRSPSDLEASVCGYLSGNPGPGSVEVVLRLLGNIVREPENPKFRRVRMSNARVKEAVADVAGGAELLEFVGFEPREEGDGEAWAVMEVPSEDWISLLRRALKLLESQRTAGAAAAEEEPKRDAETDLRGGDERVEPKKIDRQTKVFFSVPENVAAKIELPDSFFNLSIEELRREAEARKKKMADSQLLVPKSYKERQAKAARKKYTKTIIRVQFPDGVVLQAVFNPWEPTSSLYKFVRSALKEPSLEFELLHPVVVKRRVIPCFPPAGKSPITLEDEDLVPTALVKFKPLETDSLVFTGLRNELLEISEPLVSDSSDPRH